MNWTEVAEILRNSEKLQNSLSVDVKISFHEANKIILNDLIAKRNSLGNKFKKSFDDVLMYYLNKDEFKKYVTDGEVFE
jgi:hypothetical protein